MKTLLFYLFCFSTLSAFASNDGLKKYNDPPKCTVTRSASATLTQECLGYSVKYIYTSECEATANTCADASLEAFLCAKLKANAVARKQAYLLPPCDDGPPPSQP